MSRIALALLAAAILAGVVAVSTHAAELAEALRVLTMP
jgi:hypothetical protein